MYTKQNANTLTTPLRTISLQKPSNNVKNNEDKRTMKTIQKYEMKWVKVIKRIWNNLWNLANVNNKLTRTMCEFVQSNKKDARTV